MAVDSTRAADRAETADERRHEKEGGMKVLKIVVLGAALAMGCSADHEGAERSRLVLTPDQPIAFNIGHQEREPTIIPVFQGGNRLLLAAYNDEQNDTPFATKTNVGFALSTNVNNLPITWATIPTPTIDPSLIISLEGDPWLAADPDTHTIVHFVALAHATALGGGGDKIVYGKSINGGATWLVNGNGYNLVTLPATAMGCPANHDKPSIATSKDGSDIYIAYNCDPTNNNNIVHVARKIGNMAWEDRIPAGQVAGSQQTPAPIVKTKPSCPKCVFLAWQDPSAPLLTRKIVWSGSTNKGKDWSSSPFLVTSNPTLAQPFLGANATVNRNPVHFSFDLDRGTDACVVAFENNGRVYYTKADGPNYIWTAPVDVRTDFPSVREFQPFIITSTTTIVIGYYEQNPNSAVTSVRLAGSNDHGTTWPTIYNNLLTDTTFSPCGQVPSMFNPPDDGLDFGDYMGVAPLARETETTSQCGLNAQCSYQFWGGWADSRTAGSCNNGSVSPATIADPQHVVGVLSLVQ